LGAMLLTRHKAFIFVFSENSRKFLKQNNGPLRNIFSILQRYFKLIIDWQLILMFNAFC
jgi:hypothetical protein